MVRGWARLGYFCGNCVGCRGGKDPASIAGNLGRTTSGRPIARRSEKPTRHQRSCPPCRHVRSVDKPVVPARNWADLQYLEAAFSDRIGHGTTIGW